MPLRLLLALLLVFGCQPPSAPPTHAEPARPVAADPPAPPPPAIAEPAAPAEPDGTSLVAPPPFEATVRIVDAYLERAENAPVTVRIERRGRISEHTIVPTRRSEWISIVSIEPVRDGNDRFFAITLAAQSGEDCVTRALNAIVVEVLPDASVVTRWNGPVGEEHVAFGTMSDVVEAQFALREGSLVLDRTSVRDCGERLAAGDPLIQMIPGCEFTGLGRSCRPATRQSSETLVRIP